MKGMAKTVTRGQSAAPKNLAQFIKWANFFRRDAAISQEDRLSGLYILATMRERRAEDELIERMGPLPGFSEEVRPDILERWKKDPNFEAQVWAARQLELERACQTLVDIAA